MSKSLNVSCVLISAFSFLICFGIFAKGPTKFKSVKEMIETFGDYHPDVGTFQIISKSPLHIRLSPRFTAGDLPENIKDEVSSSLVYGVYRSFVHTDIQLITVTAIPKEISFKTKKHRFLNSYKRTITVSRTKALKVIRMILGINSFSNLVNDEEPDAYTWVSKFSKVYYNGKACEALIEELSK